MIRKSSSLDPPGKSQKHFLNTVVATRPHDLSTNTILPLKPLSLDDDLVFRGPSSIYLHVNNEWLKFKINELKEIVMEIHSIFIYKYNMGLP